MCYPPKKQYSRGFYTLSGCAARICETPWVWPCAASLTSWSTTVLVPPPGSGAGDDDDTVGPEPKWPQYKWITQDRLKLWKQEYISNISSIPAWSCRSFAFIVLLYSELCGTSVTHKGLKVHVLPSIFTLKSPSG